MGALLVMRSILDEAAGDRGLISLWAIIWAVSEVRNKIAKACDWPNGPLDGR